jgi:hypothetical protein
MSEIEELRDEIRKLREEITALRLSGVTHQHHHYSGPFQTPIPQPYYQPPIGPGAPLPWWYRSPVTCESSDVTAVTGFLAPHMTAARTT